MLLAGIDEAGYGPRLGPLVVTLASFGTHDTSIEERLLPAAGRDAGAGTDRLRVDDSKKIFHGKRGLASIERTALSFWFAARGRLPVDVGDLLSKSAMEPDLSATLAECAWYGPEPLKRPLPLAADGDRIARSAALLAATLKREKVDFRGFKCRVVPEPLFNRGVASCDNKAFFHAGLVLDLIIHAQEPKEGPHRNLFLVDKLGGRDHYESLLAERFHAARLAVEEEGRALSRYTIKKGPKRMEVHFIRSGDSLHFPVALASIFSKYVRELFMSLFNAYWEGIEPGIPPTAGYPGDASRFLGAVGKAAARAGIDLEELIRRR